MRKHGVRISLFDRVLLLRALRSQLFTSHQFLQLSLVIPAGLLSFGISTELRFRFSRSLCFHLDVSDTGTVIFPVLITQSRFYVTDSYWLCLSLSGYQYKNTESFCADTIPMPWVGTAFFLDEQSTGSIIWDHKICWWHLLKLSQHFIQLQSHKRLVSFLSHSRNTRVAVSGARWYQETPRGDGKGSPTAAVIWLWGISVGPLGLS